MFSTPLTSCSMGVATVSAMTSGGAAGYEARTTMVGGTTSGYWATGSPNHATMPRMTVTNESTAAKIGRSMKKRASTSAASGGGGRRFDGHVLRHDLQTGPHALDAADDHAVVGREPRAHEAHGLA